MASTIKVDQIEGSTGSTVTIPTGQTLTIVDGVPVASGGTGFASFTAGDVLYATGSTTLAKLAKGTAEQVLAMNAGATAPDWGSVDLTVLPTISVAKGGTNIASFTAGDILYATGATTLAKLAKGTGLHHLRMNAGATAPEWAAAPAGGKLLQCLGASDATERSTTSTSWAIASNTLQVTITPAATTSKIFITAHTETFDSAGQQKWYTIMRDSTNLGHASYGLGGDEGYDRQESTSFNFLDSPSSTSAIVYGVQMRTNSGTIYMQKGGGGSYPAVGHITVMEIGA